MSTRENTTPSLSNDLSQSDLSNGLSRYEQSILIPCQNQAIHSNTLLWIQMIYPMQTLLLATFIFLSVSFIRVV